MFNTTSCLARAESWIEISASPAPLANSAMMSTLIALYKWEDETARERTGHPPSYAEAQKMKLLTLHIYGCPNARLRDCSSSTIIVTKSQNLLLQTGIQGKG